MFTLLDKNTINFTTARHIFRNPKFWVILLVDVIFLFAALYVSYFLRYEGGIEARSTFYPYLVIFPLMVLIKIPVFYFFGLYRGMWRYTSTQDLLNIMKATVVAFIIILVVLVYVNRLVGLSRSVFILDSIFSFLLICGHRVGIRYLYKGKNGSRNMSSNSKKQAKRRLLLIGAGDAAETVLRELRNNENLPYLPVGMVDDNPNKVGLRIHGVPVLGAVRDIREHIIRSRAEELLIAVATARREEMSRFLELCQATGKPFKVLPAISEIIDGQVSIKKMRDISLKDLLGREEVTLEQDKIGQYLTGKTILVTGAGGSIGSELCRQILRFSPGHLILLDSSEENIYSIQMELQHEYAKVDVITVLGRIQDAGLLRLIFSKHHPTVVFHAAAYKHVPLVERNPWQAVYNNILATQLLIEASITHQVESFVMVSTDKAVRPTNVMGASKRITELLMLAYQQSNWDGSFSNLWIKSLEKEKSFKLNGSPVNHVTRFMAVRFGNVIGSSGSVIPLFMRQIEKGGPVTVAHPEITRYFMSIDEAAQLILQAGSMGEGGEIFILKMGDPIKIDRLARDLIKLARRELSAEIEIRYIGLREGEKLFEELITEGEGIIETHHEKIMVLRSKESLQCSKLHQDIRQLVDYANSYSSQDIKETLQNIIPEYQPDNNSHSVGNE